MLVVGSQQDHRSVLLGKAEWELLELSRAARQPHRGLLVEELRSQEKRSLALVHRN